MNTLYESERGDIEIALTGETLLCRSLAVHREPNFLKLVELLRKADLTFTNAESIFQDWSDSPNTFGGGGAPGGTYMVTPPELIADMKWAGIDVVATANNHASDFGEAGVLTNLRFLKEHGMPQSGMGRNLTEASMATYIDTAKGRVAMLAACDWGVRGAGDIPWPFPMGVMAAEQSPYSRGRPGVNLVRYQPEITIDRVAFDALRRISEKMNWSAARDSRRQVSVGFDRPATGAKMGEEEDSDNVFHFMGTKFTVGDSFALRTVAEAEDIERQLKWIRDARRMADWVLYSFHSHSSTPSVGAPPTHALELAHACIDNGADVYIGHGSGRDRGIEIYQGKPIFYGLGIFVGQNDQVPVQPYELLSRFGLGYDNTAADFYDARSGGGTRGPRVGHKLQGSVVAVLNYDQKKLKTIKLNPVDLAIHLPPNVRGRPILAEPGSELYKHVISNIQKLSAVYGTRVSDDGVVVVSE